MKKFLAILILFTSVLFLFGCLKEDDALKFKEEYESVNGEKNDSGKANRSLSIPEDNPFVYASANDIIKLMDDKASFVVYFGFKTCPWCRSVLPSLIDASKDDNIDTIYYVDVLDIRNELKVEDGSVVESKKGSKGYYKLLEYFDEVLEDYDLGEDVSTSQKRIYAPNIVSVVNGSAYDMISGVSKRQTDAYMNLTTEIKSDMYSAFDGLFKEYNKQVNLCSNKGAC